MAEIVSGKAAEDAFDDLGMTKEAFFGSLVDYERAGLTLCGGNYVLFMNLVTWALARCIVEAESRGEQDVEKTFLTLARENVKNLRAAIKAGAN